MVGRTEPIWRNRELVKRMKVAVVTFAAIWPVLLDTRAGVRSLDPVLLDTARCLHLGWFDCSRKCVVPALMPAILLGVRVAAPVARVITLLVEILTRVGGLGGLIDNNRPQPAQLPVSPGVGAHSGRRPVQLHAERHGRGASSPSSFVIARDERPVRDRAQCPVVSRTRSEQPATSSDRRGRGGSQRPRRDAWPGTGFTILAMTEAIAFTSLDDFLDGEERGERRHELVGGRVYAMAGGSERHDLAAGLLYEVLAAGARARGCRPFTSNRLVRTRSGNAYYPDVMVACGPAPHRHYETDPALVVEVLSPSTANVDRREKAVAYTEAASLRLFVLVDPDTRRMELARPANGAIDTWEVCGPGDVLATELGDIDVDAVYDMIDRTATTA